MVNRSESAAPSAQPLADATRSALSSLMDGDPVPGAVADACRAWRDDADARACWHAYQLIGDVLRSEDLAQPAGRDQAFLQGLRERLAAEPVPLAPAPLAAAPAVVPASGAGLVAAGPARRRRLGWLVAPAAVAAGFVAVAGVAVVLRSGTPAGGDGASGPTLAGNVQGAGAVVPVELVRDARLDRYLDAHRTLANGAAAVGGAEQRVHIVLDAK